MLHEKLTEKIIESFYRVYNKLGYGFLESVYENALLIELIRKELVVANQVPIEVLYRKQKVGAFFADILVEDKVILELKASRKLLQEHEFQLVNYLRATNIEVGLLLNFGKKPEFKRKIFSNNT